MNINDLNTIEQMEQFLTGSQAVAFLVASSKDECYLGMESMQNRGRQLSNLFEFFIIRRSKAWMPVSKRLFQFAVEYPYSHL